MYETKQLASRFETLSPAKLNGGLDLDVPTGVPSPPVMPPIEVLAPTGGDVSRARLIVPTAGLSPGRRPTVLDRLIDETAANAVREFLRAQFPAPNPRSPFAPLFERMKHLAFKIAARDPLGHLTEDAYERRLKNTVQKLISPRDLQVDSSWLKHLTYAAVGDILAAGGIPDDWRASLGARIPLVAPAGAAPSMLRRDGGGGSVAQALPDLAFGPTINVIQCLRETALAFVGSDQFSISGIGMHDGEPVMLETFLGDGFDDGDTQSVGHEFAQIPMVPDRFEVPFRFMFQPFEDDPIGAEDIKEILGFILDAISFALIFAKDVNEAITRDLPLPGGDKGRAALHTLRCVEQSAAFSNRFFGTVSRAMADMAFPVVAREDELFTRYEMTGTYTYEKTNGNLLKFERDFESRDMGDKAVLFRFTVTRQPANPQLDDIVVARDVTLRQAVVAAARDGGLETVPDVSTFEPEGRGFYSLTPGIAVGPSAV